MKENDDEVVAEYDVYLAPCPSDVYLLQFPLRSKGQPLGVDRKIVSGRVRPRQQRMELQVELVPEGARNAFQRERLRSFGANPVQTLAGAAAPHGHVANYVAARFDGKELTLVPIDALLQLRPDFSYVDTFSAETARKDAAADKVDHDHDGETSAGEESGVEAIDVKFQRRETERAEERRKKSYAYLKGKQEEEPWIDLKVLTGSHPECKESSRRVFDKHKPDSSSKLAPLSGRRYVKMLSPFSEVQPRPPGQSVADTFLGPLSRRELLALSLQSAVEQIMLRVRIASSDAVCEMLEWRHRREHVVAALESCAFMLRTSWVSNELNFSSRSELVRCARDRILFLFTEQETVSFAEAKAAAYEVVNDQLIEEILLDVATRVKGKGWEIRLPDDPRADSDLVAGHAQKLGQRNAAADKVLCEVRAKMR